MKLYIFDASSPGRLMVCNLNYQTVTCEFESHWVPLTSLCAAFDNSESLSVYKKKKKKEERDNEVFHSIANCGVFFLSKTEESNRKISIIVNSIVVGPSTP